jgi:diaminopimelate decarboxylase
MHHFQYHGNELYCEDVPIRVIADEVGTPFYLYSRETLTRHYRAIDEAFESVSRLVCFSAKANTNLSVLRLFANLGSGLDIVSGGEMFRGLKAGFTPDKIVYSGVGKRLDEIDFALESGILMFNVESLEELSLINARAKSKHCKAPIAIRVNPDVDPQTHPYISTGLKKNKFGLDVESALEGYRMARQMDHIEIVGIDCHIGSQITQSQPFREAMGSLKNLIQDLNEQGIAIRYLDIGGGLGITYDDEQPLEPVEYGRTIIDALKGLDLQLILEPGRVIVGNAGVLVTQVLYRKSGTAKEFVIVDAAMNDLMRPSLYSSYHRIQPILKDGRPEITADVVGPICESGDFLAVDRPMPDFRRGDLMAVMSAGAYGFTMSSNYCSRVKAAEVMVAGEEFHVVRRRQTFEDLVRGETLPPFL